jgi:hypothetical protein
MTRFEALTKIDGLLNTCRGCETRERMNREMKGLFAKMDGHCIRNCNVGVELQQLGKELHVGPRKKFEEGMEADAIA